MIILRGIAMLICMCACLMSLQAQEELLLYPKDSVLIETDSCTTDFFAKATKVVSPAKTILINKAGKSIILSKYMATDDLSSFGQYGLLDLDLDGKMELLIFSNTGGAHCCDELTIYKNIGPNKYQFAVRTFGGDVCMTPSNQFRYSFYQSFGYFFTCFACSYTDTSEAAPVPVRSIGWRYGKGKLVVIPDQDLRVTITDNLALLKEQPYEKLEEAADQDNGLRKEFAMNLAVFYYSFGKNIAETQSLFNKYYTYPDAKKVWTAFVKQINYLKGDNTL